MAFDITKRIKELEAEYQAGVQRLAGLQQEQQRVTATMQRLAGAVAVLNELLAVKRPDPTPVELAPAPPIEE